MKASIQAAMPQVGGGRRERRGEGGVPQAEIDQTWRLEREARLPLLYSQTACIVVEVGFSLVDG